LWTFIWLFTIFCSRTFYCQFCYITSYHASHTCIHLNHYFWSFVINWFQHLSVENWIPLSVGARGREGCCTFSLTLMCRLNQTEVAISCNFVVINTSEDHTLSRFMEIQFQACLHWRYYCFGIPHKLCTKHELLFCDSFFLQL
jgi:hypothetical protein